MNKGDLVDAVSERTNLTKKDVETVISATIDVIMKAVAEGDKVTLVGFGAIEPRKRSAREGRNPRTGETMLIPETTVPAFSAGKQFKELVSSR